MKKILFVLTLIGYFSILSSAQTTSDDYNKFEVFAGYSGTNLGGNTNPIEHGFNISAVYNLHKYIGIKADGSATFKNSNGTSRGVAFTPGGKFKVQNIAAGVQFKNSSFEKTVKPFAHALIGYGKFSSKVQNVETIDRGPALIIGGGLDININHRIEVRAIQVDYLGIIELNRVDRSTSRFSAGVIFKF